MGVFGFENSDHRLVLQWIEFSDASPHGLAIVAVVNLVIAHMLDLPSGPLFIEFLNLLIAPFSGLGVVGWRQKELHVRLPTQVLHRPIIMFGPAHTS
jgi:hypothetical protein